MRVHTVAIDVSEIGAGVVGCVALDGFTGKALGALGSAFARDCMGGCSGGDGVGAGGALAASRGDQVAGRLVRVDVGQLEQVLGGDTLA
ncbi:hypothetical protein INP48_02300 [Xanthomonas perforans]|nr:hypothetical protein [Xanthomonas perforans]